MIAEALQERHTPHHGIASVFSCEPIKPLQIESYRVECLGEAFFGVAPIPAPLPRPRPDDFTAD